MAGSYTFRRELSGPNEVFAPDGSPRRGYGPVLDEIGRLGPGGWRERTERARELLLDEQRSLGLAGEDRMHPTDYVPRVVPAADWEILERGLAQRMRAINEWLRRLEAGKKEIVPDEVVGSSTLFDASAPLLFGSVPNRQMGFDVVAVEGEGGGVWEYVVIEDNAKMPVGMEPMHLLREATPAVLPEAYAALGVRPLGGIVEDLGEVLRAASPKGEPTLAVLSGGPEDQYFIDHKVFAETLGAILAGRHEVELDRGGYLVHRPSGRRIDVVYERIEEGRIYDDLPGLVESQAKGLVRAIFPPGLGIADDKGVYPFIPDMIRTYLGEEPAVGNAQTYSLAVEEDRRYVMDHFGELVVKSRSGWGGKDVLIAPQESEETIREFRRKVEENPVEYIAQETLDFSTHVLCEADAGEVGQLVLRDSYADLRVHALAPDAEAVRVVPGAMTRVAAPGSKLVNVSSGGKVKDTWVLTDSPQRVR